jgi:hypothetical protein
VAASLEGAAAAAAAAAAIQSATCTNERQRIENHLRICLIPRHQPSATLQQPLSLAVLAPSAAAKRFHSPLAGGVLPSKKQPSTYK